MENIPPPASTSARSSEKRPASHFSEMPSSFGRRSKMQRTSNEDPPMPLSSYNSLSRLSSDQAPVTDAQTSVLTDNPASYHNNDPFHAVKHRDSHRSRFPTPAPKLHPTPLECDSDSDYKMSDLELSDDEGDNRTSGRGVTVEEIEDEDSQFSIRSV